MTKRETTEIKASITKKRALTRLPELAEIKKQTDWETVARKLYEILQDVDINPTVSISSKLKQAFIPPKKTGLPGRKPKDLPWSIQDFWVPFCISLKKEHQLKSNIQAARHAINIMLKNNLLKISPKRAEQLAENLAKRISEKLKKS